MTQLPFKYFDCDNHYYEAVDAFTRHIEPQYRKRAIQWAQLDGRQRLLVGGRVNRFIPNPTFDPVGKPGALDEYFRGRNPKGADLNALFGELEPISPAYRDRDARLALMDEQGMQGAILLPTLGVGMEQALLPDLDAAAATFRAFNRWMDEDHFYKKILVSDPSLQTSKEFCEKVAKLSLGDFTDMLSFQGLQVIDVFGDYQLSNYDVRKTPRMIILSKKQN